MSFSSNGSFSVKEISGSDPNFIIDPAGALERYGAATKSFQHVKEVNRRCKNFYLAAVYTAELERRIAQDPLVEKTFDIIKILDDPLAREQFFAELFHHTLRLV